MPLLAVRRAAPLLVSLLTWGAVACTASNPLYSGAPPSDARDAPAGEVRPDTGGGDGAAIDVPPETIAPGSGGAGGQGGGGAGSGGTGAGSGGTDGNADAAMDGADALALDAASDLAAAPDVPAPPDVPAAPDVAGAMDAADATDVLDAEVGPPVASPGCGTDRSQLASIANARGIAIDSAGVVYFTREQGTQTFIARMRPGQTAELTWKTVPMPNAGARALRVDTARNRLFVALTNANVVLAGPLDAASFTSELAHPGAHGIAVAGDGTLFVTCSDNLVRWVRLESPTFPRGVATDVPVFSPGQRPLGIALGPAGQMFVGSSGGGIKRFDLEGTRLVRPADHGVYAGTALDLATDADGRLFIAEHTGLTSAFLVSIPPEGGLREMTNLFGRFAGLAFGRGTRACADLYVTDVGGAAQLLPHTRPGFALP